MQHIRKYLPALVLMLVGATAALATTEMEIPLSEVPQQVLAAAQDAVPGIELTETEVEKTLFRGLVWALEGTVDGKERDRSLSQRLSPQSRTGR